jgi:predicted transcriptional regulator
MAEILNLCRKPQTKTQVMYATNLSYATLQSYLSQLKSGALLEVRHSIARYATTEKGLKYLEKWSELQKLLQTEDKRTDTSKSPKS